MIMDAEIMNRHSISKYTIFTVALILIFFAVNLLFLTQYPFVHSDETWLAGLTRNMMQRHSLAVTETFFNLKPRYPHAIKTLFHLLQMPFLSLFGYRIFSVRLISLLAGSGGLFVFYQIGKVFFQSEKKAIFAMLLLAVDSEYICASHFARQEILILLLMLICIALLMKHSNEMTNRLAVMLGIITGIAIGFHPNSFMIACVCGGILLLRILLYKTAKFRQLLLYAGVTSLFALTFVGISFLFDSNFISHYLTYGNNEFDVLAPVSDKFGSLGNYFAKLYYRVSGTYYIPNVKLQFFIFPTAMILSILYAAVMKNKDSKMSQNLVSLLTAIFMIIVSTALIGRYSQLSIVFVFSMCWLLTVFACFMFGKTIGKVLGVCVLSAVLTFTLTDIRPWLSADSYDIYLSQIEELIPQDSVTIGNLNSDFYFDNGVLLDYRNLSYLSDDGMSIADYIDAYNVQYIIITDELDYIYSVRPTWNIIYGNPVWVSDLQNYADLHCEYMGTFEDNTYNVRIVSYVNGSQNFSAWVYRVMR